MPEVFGRETCKPCYDGSLQKSPYLGLLKSFLPVHWSELTSWNDNLAKDKTVTVTEKRRKIDGSNRDGLAYVPYDGYISELHKGERVLTAQENKSLSLAGMGNITMNITGNHIASDYDVDRIGDKIIDKLRKEIRR